MVEKEEALKLLWAYERRAAYDEASLDARLQFNRCPVCGKWVCDECFCIEGKNGSVCKDCDGAYSGAWVVPS